MDAADDVTAGNVDVMDRIDKSTMKECRRESLSVCYDENAKKLVLKTVVYVF